MMVKVERQIGANTLSIETGKLAKQAHGATLARYGDTVVLGTCVTADPRPGIDFFPLSVDYREKMSAAGKFPGGFFKREGRPTTKEVLTSRMIDRPMRPLFPEGFRNEVQVQVMVLSADAENDPDVIGMVAAAAAVSISGVPFNGPVAAVRVGRIDRKFVINPSRAQLEYSDLDMVLAGHRQAVNMIEVGCRELSEEEVAEAVKFGHENGIVPICEMIEELQRQAGRPVTWEKPEPDAAFIEDIRRRVLDDLKAAKTITGKQERNEAVKAIYDRVIEELCPEGAENPEHTPDEVKAIISSIEEEYVRQRILKDHVRPDGRKLTEIRPISAEVGWLPRVHGSALFSRGETQAMVTCTLGTSRDEQIVDDLVEEYSKKFLLHYNFPPFSVGEVRKIMGPGRREIGHGALAERSLEAVLPSPDAFPYTIRIVSDILESNGSSSMATVCGGSLSLMDAGVPISSAVAGISVGLVEGEKKHVLLADIIGEEDHFGDMDFKVAGTRKGITGIQLDIKTQGLKHNIMVEALELARKCRLHILEQMDKALAEPRPEVSPNAPRLITIKINPEKIGKLIGPGGKSIKAIQAATGAQIDIEDDGTVFISCTDAAKAKKAQEAVERITEDIQIGRIYEGRVTSIKDFGAFIEIQDGQDGLCHISELADSYVKSVADVVQIGDHIKVKVIAIDEQGRVKLSRRAALREENGEEPEAVGPRRDKRKH
ncbi:MAG: polyribonucleotide nucleotidyltransferase [Phycisphaerae bacterium]|jgi:polyribonucleotide nucleotidyltransferase|nr:polyribonucleotide nucleotidyltransferase [Phycisphaerae bacterium]HOO16270.1 polyribonucleotide nucleotidyltransferase [Phycisphaerae bacterium]HPC22695.1 polyribonucleotide nucleotidyltransferase [Phycisphaerae bacterium]HRS29244.1 polyribonucleotide nucleotidyltransferase [Phycisphaerae bacterium]HRT41733.1 polyribonucleotide nucleotidyltransferase [Phycisphaerae bacterium]